MQDNELEPTTIRIRFAYVRNVVRAAVRDRVLARDVTAGVKLPRVRKASAAMTIPTAPEVGAAIRAADDIEPRYSAFIAVCAFAGLRRGETSALKVSDVDFMRKEVHVRRQVQWTADGQMEIRGPKYGSERTVFAADSLITMLAEHVRIYCGGDDPDRWLFPRPAMPACRPTQRPWDGRGAWYARRPGVGQRLHDLQHFYASGLIASGCDVVTVQRALGHSSASVTLDTYSHLWPDRTRKAAAGLQDQAFETAAGGLRTEG